MSGSYEYKRTKEYECVEQVEILYVGPKSIKAKIDGGDFVFIPYSVIEMNGEKFIVGKINDRIYVEKWFCEKELGI